MSRWMDLLQGIPVNAVLRERILLMQEQHDHVLQENEKLRKRVEELEKENSELHAQVPTKAASSLDEEAEDVMVYLFRSSDDERDVGTMCRSLKMERGVADHQLDTKRRSAGPQDGDGLGMAISGNKETITFHLADPAAHGHGLRRRRRFIEQRRIGDLHPCQISHHGLEVQQSFESAL